MHKTAHLTPMHRWQHTPLGRTCAHVLVLLMALHGWPLWAQTVTWQPERYAPLWHGITWLLSPLDAQAMTPCDVDDNGIINGLDIQAIFTSQEDTAAADDPRDPDGDGVITVNDARACVLQCTEPSCVTLVPDVVGALQANAEATLLAANLTVGTVSEVSSGSVPPGVVLSQDPAGGARVPFNSAVDLVVSLGPEPVTVPDVVGLFQGDAEAALLDVELTVGTITQVSSPTVPFGEVISQTPAAGTSALTGSAVDLEVSIATLPSGDLIRPAVQITLAAGSVGLNEPITITVSATDGGGIAATTVLINGTPVTLDANGMATFNSPTPGVFTVEATVLDTAGNEGFATAEFRVLTAGDGVLPTVDITAPTDGAELTIPTDIIGTVSDETAVLRYVIEASLAGQEEFFRVAGGTTAVTNGVLGQFDPTLLRNGIYDVRLTVEDTSGNTSSVLRTYEVDGDAKVGNFSLVFEDVTIPVSGIPITITRTYDSSNKSQGDFGVGWTLDIKDGKPAVELYESVTLGTEWEQKTSGESFPAYTLEPTRPHFVVVRFPDGRVETFDLVVNPESQQLVPLTFTNAAFQADTTTISSLLSLDNNNNLLFSNGGGIGPLTLLNPDASLYDPDRYQLTDTNGMVYIIQQPTGLESITDRNGNTVTFGPDGIIHSAGKSVTFTRDAQGRLITTITDPLGNTLRYTYDFYGDLVSVLDQENNVTQFQYNSNHGLLDIIDPRGIKAARNEYDDDGRVIATIDADGNRTEFTYDIAARREEILDRLGNTTVYEYDERGNITATISPRGHRIEFTYDERDNRLTMKDPFNKIITFAYDENDNLKTRIDPLGNAESFTYNAFNQILTRTDARGGVTTFTYDANGNRTSAKYPEDNEFTSTYDAAGNPQKIIDPTLAETTLAYDPFGNLIQGTNQLQGTTTFGYDANGNLTSLAPPGQPAHTFAYTPTELEQTYTPPTLGPQPPEVATTFDYDPALNLTRITRPDGLTVEFAHDTVNRVLTTTFPPPASFPPGGRTVSLTYDAAGQLLTATAPDTGMVTHTYDTSLLATSTWTGTIAGSVERTYDALDRLATQSVNGGQSVTYTYNDGGFLTGAGALALGRTPQGGLLANTTLGVVSDASIYDGNKNVLTYQATAGVAVLLDQQYTRDALGRVSQKVEMIDGTTTIFDYTYDATGQLTQVTQDGSIVTTYTYDPNGNREQQGGPGGAVTGTYDTQDRLLSWGNATYTYTANGELNSKTVGSQTTTYAYDVLGDLLTVTLPDTTQIEYIVDGENRRIGKIVNGTLVQGFLYQDELNPVAELDASGTVTARFVYGSREHVPAYMIKGGTTYRLISDLLGSVRLVVDTTTGVIAQRLDYDAFGQILLDTNPGFQPFGFAGGLYDQDTKLTRFGARDYEAETGRWTAKDPIRFEGKDTNLYRYVQNDPINFYDPTGNIGSSEHFATLPILGTLTRLAVSTIGTLNRLHHAVPKQILEHLFRTVGNTSYLRFLRGVRGLPNRVRICAAFHEFLHYGFVRTTAGGVQATGVNRYLLGVIWEASAQGITGLALVKTVANATLYFTENAAAVFMLGGGMALCP